MVDPGADHSAQAKGSRGVILPEVLTYSCSREISIKQKHVVLSTQLLSLNS